MLGVFHCLLDSLSWESRDQPKYRLPCSAAVSLSIGLYIGLLSTFLKVSNSLILSIMRMIQEGTASPVHPGTFHLLNDLNSQVIEMAKDMYLLLANAFWLHLAWHQMSYLIYFKLNFVFLIKESSGGKNGMLIHTFIWFEGQGQEGYF